MFGRKSIRLPQKREYVDSRVGEGPSLRLRAQGGVRILGVGLRV